MSLLLTAALLLTPARGPVEIELERLLVVEATAPGRRSPVAVDAIEAQVVRGTFLDPHEGLEVERAQGEPLVWRPLEVGADGWFDDPALRGGWGFATIELDEPAVMILDASGHRRVYVNGVPRMGDVYGLGITQLPVALEAGTNRFLFRGGRGRLRAKLVKAPEGPYFVEHDRVLPDVLRGELGASKALVAGVRVGNPTREWVSIGCGTSVEGVNINRPPVALPPLSVTSLGFTFGVAQASDGDTLALELALRSGDETVAAETLGLALKDRHEKHKRTFSSEVDGSVQYYAVTPPSRPAEEGDEPLALVLSLHGASVQATNQAYSYAPKDWAVVVAPTNRRPFGFDWEDWGRYDALEVFELARRDWNTDPRRQYLTGHSMGGHGTWNLGAHLAGTFAAIAPSAGWRDFWAYGTDEAEERDPVDQLLADAANPSRTLLLKENYLHAGVYVLHGDADDNVGVEQARFMRSVLSDYHPNFAYYERPGAGHWWGNECIDWPPLFEFLENNVGPAPEDVRSVTFTTVNPAVHATTHWVTIHAQERSLEPSRVEVALDAERRRITVATENVSTLKLDLAAFVEPRSGAAILALDEPLTVVVDGTELELDEWDFGPLVHLRREAGAWTAKGHPSPVHKTPERAGPFKDAFRGHMVFVYGTRGDDERDALLLQKARFDAEVFGYRGNGAVEILADTEFDPFESIARLPRRNVILYGNADDHALWTPLLGESPVQVSDGAVRAGDRTVEGDDLVCLLVRPHPGDVVAAVAAVAPTGDVGARLAIAPPYFVSGVGYPDWTVIGADMLERGSEGVRAAGFFGPDWGLESGRSAWR